MAVLGSLDVDVFVAIITLLVGYYYLRKSLTRKKRSTYITSKFSFRKAAKVMTGKVSFVQGLNEHYHEFKEHRFGGLFSFGADILVVCDLELIKQILTKDFNAFHDRGLPHDENKDPFSATLVSLKGHRWKTLRAQLSPTFTSGKIKVMVPLIHECTRDLKDVIQDKIQEKNGSIEMKELLIRFTTDVIGTCAFGIQCNSLKNANSEFYTVSREVFRNTAGNLIRMMLLDNFPRLASVWTFKRHFPKVVSFYNDIISQTVKFRRENNVERNDFVQLMMKINEEDPTSFKTETMAAQAFIFFFAGLDNVALNVGFCLHAMALDPDLQEKVYEEVHTVLEEFEGEMSYEVIGKMDLVSRVIDEGLRLYPPAGVLVRRQTDERYLMPGTDVEFKKGTTVMIPVHAIHRDEEYFPNPDKFDPDRFTEDEKLKRHPYAYIPFGEGPRFCIASRFALMEMRLCFAELVRNFRFGIASETETAMELDTRAPGPSPKNGFWLSVSERN